jgi:hypothetical protein
MERLRRCPFCGEKPVGTFPWLLSEVNGNHYLTHYCEAAESCICVKAKTKDEVIDAWNGEKIKEAKENEEV